MSATHLLKTNPLGRKIVKGISTSLLGRAIGTYKDLATVSVSITYTTKSDPTPRTKMVDIDLFAGDTNGSKVQAMRGLKKSALRSDDNKVVYDNLNGYNWKVIWLNEMGEEEVEFCETILQRNALMQGLADDGYSPIYREVK
jgi:hypothetical protein